MHPYWLTASTTLPGDQAECPEGECLEAWSGQDWDSTIPAAKLWIQEANYEELFLARTATTNGTDVHV